MSDAKHPCGCHDALTMDFASLELGSAEIPSLDEWEQKLQAISSIDSGGASALGELELAGLDASLAALDELSLDSIEGEDMPSLCDLLRLLERYPGLKLSLSY